MNDTKLSQSHIDLNASYSEELKNELLKLYKTDLIVNILKYQNAPLSVENRALLSLYQFDGPLPLGLDHLRHVELTYHDRVALNRFVESKIVELAQPAIQKLRKLTDNNLDAAALGAAPYKQHSEVLELEAEKRALSEKLLKLKNRKIHFMNLCAEMRTGPYQRNNVETKNAESKALQIKAETIQKVMIHEVITSTAHAVKAVKEVEANIDSLLSLK
ncbi:hypothetical protein quinque_001899 [Culex quinquefasciatus]|uniref:uncharacterized protein LOC6041571 n=1 Tax=Culex quinquefasciatus TaxID=7176 RepID=UPI0018E2EE2C|nr:uncharacterized protein LOC6041571 [Culex quinquefasciatus]XP_038119337.1 uncharacterized protein LOC6041571 [Culex quinquefasciatus]